MTTMNSSNKGGRVALVFGISGDQGQYVATGLLASGDYEMVYGVTHHSKEHVHAIDRQLGMPIILRDINALSTDKSNGDSLNTLTFSREIYPMCTSWRPYLSTQKPHTSS